MAQATKARVFMNGGSQHVTIPAEYRFNTAEVYIQKDPTTGTLTLSEKPLRSSMAEVFERLDQAGAADFVLERDLSLPPENNLF